MFQFTDMITKWSGSLFNQQQIQTEIMAYFLLPPSPENKQYVLDVVIDWWRKKKMVLIFYSPFHQEVVYFYPPAKPSPSWACFSQWHINTCHSRKKYLCTGTRFLWLLVEHSHSFPLQFTFCFPATFYLWSHSINRHVPLEPPGK